MDFAALRGRHRGHFCKKFTDIQLRFPAGRIILYSYTRRGGITMDYKRCWAAVDLAALSHNYHCIRRFLSPGCRYLAIVKADGYGHGAATVAGQLQKDGADWFGVATMEEALDLRRPIPPRPLFWPAIPSRKRCSARNTPCNWRRRPPKPAVWWIVM